MLDSKDRKLLQELIYDSRQSITQLARKIGLGRETTQYRFNKLKQEVIHEFTTHINLQALGFERHTCFVQLGGLSKSQEEHIIDFLATHKAVMWLGTLTGRWTLVFDIIASNIQDLERSMREITYRLGEHVLEFKILSNVVEEVMFPTKIINLRPGTNLAKQKQHIKMDSIDKQILSLLSNNARAEYALLSEKLQLSANAIKDRIKRMKKGGIILGHSISFRYEAFGLEYYNIQLISKPSSNMELLKRFLREDTIPFYYYHYLGNDDWNWDVGVLVHNAEELRSFLTRLKERNELRVVNMYRVNREFKGFYPPQKAFEEEMYK